MTDSWSPSSWQEKNTLQQVNYPDGEHLQQVLSELKSLPPLVTSWEVKRLKSQLADAAQGKRFLLQGGDCSENFAECESSILAAKLKILLQMSVVLVYGSRKHVIRVGRFAGQYAKPRSANEETKDGETLPVYRGDLVNEMDFTLAARTPNPERLLMGYQRAALTLNFIRALSGGGFADLHHPEYWNLDFVEHSPHASDYHEMVKSISDSVSFMETIVDGSIESLNRVEFFSSHEALHLPYEQAQTRQVPRRTGWFNLSTHFPWIGDRTRGLDGGHVEFLRGIENPIGMKVGPSMEPQELLKSIEVLNPHNEPGRLTLIHRFGAKKIDDHLPALIEAVNRAGKIVLWCCDPMHGNTRMTDGGFKTRSFEDILSELEQAFEIHKTAHSILGGVHFELTGDDVTECVGGARGLKDADLSKCYRTQVDPRLNGEQALEMAMKVSKLMSK